MACHLRETSCTARSSTDFFCSRLHLSTWPVLLNVNRKRPKITIKVSDSANWLSIKIEIQNAVSKLTWFSELLGNYFLYLSTALIYSFTLVLAA